jgi:retron-type reverse transcriptase
MSELSNLPQGTRPANRQDLYDLIRKTSKDEFILQDMKRLGFWPKDNGQPSLSEQIITRETELHRELSALLTEKRRLEDQQAMLKELRKQRLAESRKKREETKQKREQQRKDKAEAWKAKKQQEIIYLGEEISGGLNETLTNTEKLASRNLPVIADAASLASNIDIPVNELRFLAFSRKVSKITHYKRYYIPKKTGGQRLISAPMARLKKVQHWVLQNILYPIQIHEAAHGFLPNKSIVSNAKPHVGAEILINIDLKDFFPSVTYRRVKGLFQTLGYSEAIATILSLLCTEPDTDEAELDGETWYIATGERYLPQGSPASPAITNILCARLDSRLTGLAKKFGFTYTRYADDMTFSTSGEGIKNVNILKKNINKVIEDEGFVLHPNKTRIMRKGSRKEVTGLVVNEKPSIERKTLRNFRALLFQLQTEGLEGKKWGNSSDILSAIEGYANFVYMVDPVKGAKMQLQIKEIIQKWASTRPKRARKAYPKKVASLTEPTVPSKEPIMLLQADSLPSVDTQDTTEAKKTWWNLWKK